MGENPVGDGVLLQVAEIVGDWQKPKGTAQKTQKCSSRKGHRKGDTGHPQKSGRTKIRGTPKRGGIKGVGDWG